MNTYSVAIGRSATLRTNPSAPARHDEFRQDFPASLRSTGWACRRIALLLSLLVCVCAGCDDTLFTVTGDVTFDGKPVQTGSIVFEPADGNSATAGGKIENGRYSISGKDGLSPGKKIVQIIATRKTGQREAGPPFPPGTMVDVIERYIPEKYNYKSTLTCEVIAGENEHDFHLKSQQE